MIHKYSQRTHIIPHIKGIEIVLRLLKLFTYEAYKMFTIKGDKIQQNLWTCQLQTYSRNLSTEV